MKNLLKRTVATILCICIVLCLVCCKKINSDKDAEATTEATETIASETTAAAEGTGAKDETEETEAAETEEATEATEATETAEATEATEGPEGTETPELTETPSVTATATIEPTATPTVKPTATATAKATTKATATATAKATTKVTATPTPTPVTMVDFDVYDEGICNWVDEVYANSYTTLSGDGDGNDYLEENNYKLTFTQGTYTSITIRGWIGFESKIVAMGYAIDKANPVFVADYTDGETEQAVKNLAGSNATRYSITIPTGDLSVATHKIVLVAKMSDGTIVKLNGERDSTNYICQLTFKITAQGVWPTTYDGTYGLNYDEAEDLVGICYSVWFDFVNTRKNFTPSSSNLIEKLMVSGNWCDEGETFYYWGEPALGFYKSTDRTVIRTHMTQLAEAGVDFIIVDNTNIDYSWLSATCSENIGNPNRWATFITNPLTALFEECALMRSEGLDTPYIVLWNRAEEEGSYWKTTNWMYDKFFKNEKYKDLWVYENGKPFFILTLSSTSVSAVGTPTRDISYRKMWGLTSSLASKEWTYLQKNNTNKGSSNEQMCVCVAMQTTYMSNCSSTSPAATGRNHGITFYNQWKNAFAARPKVVTLTWWNEWCAQKQTGNRFVDNYNTEYSRDIEPMKGGHGDQYYQWMKQYIAAYKAHASCPRLVEDGY